MGHSMHEARTPSLKLQLGLPIICLKGAIGMLMLTNHPTTDLPAYSDTVYSDALLTVTLLACHK